MALGTPVGFRVGGFVGIGISGVGFGDMDGLADIMAVGAVEFMSDGIAVSRVEGAELGTKDMVGADVFTIITGASVGIRVGVIVIFGMDGDDVDGDDVGSSLVIFIVVGAMFTGICVGAGVVCALTVSITIKHRTRRHAFVIDDILARTGSQSTATAECRMLLIERRAYRSVLLKG